MFEPIADSIRSALGLALEAKELTVLQMSLRALVVFVAATAMVRLGDKRFMGKSTALDVMLGFVFGSVISRAITGNAPFFPALAAGGTLVLAHWLFSAVALRSHTFGCLVKGHDTVLVRGGVLQTRAMKRSQITEHDLLEALRTHGHPADLSRIQDAHLERNGSISIITR